jgi:lipopolysaccharide biosynthesis glycosyltransferase
MKSLIYTICDNTYLEVLNIWKENIQKYNDTDILVICPKSFVCPDDLATHRLDNFEYKYTAKFSINDFNNVSEYDNFLYLDLDILCLKQIDHIFEKIDNNKNIIHGVKEGHSLRHSGPFHRFMEIDPETIDEKYAIYNAGTFGFNKNMLPIFLEYLQYTNQHLNSLCDQPIFNMFFNQKELIQPTLWDDVYLIDFGVNQHPMNQYPLIHFVGAYGDPNYKLGWMRNFKLPE